MIESVKHQNHVIRMQALCRMVGLSKSSIYARLDPGSPYYDETFPKGFKIGNSGRCRARGWYEADVVRWVNAQAGKEVMA